jgi:hypothetical protein
MKRLILIALATLFVVSCCNPISGQSNDKKAGIHQKGEGKYTNIRRYDIRSTLWNEEYIIFSLEGCEYIQSSGDPIVHKANCPNPEHKVVTTRVDSIFVIIQPDGTKTIQRQWGW